MEQTPSLGVPQAKQTPAELLGVGPGMQGGPDTLEGLRSPALAAVFRDVALGAGLKPDCQWVGGYADYEWQHLRPVMDAYSLSLSGKNVIELGTNVGGSAVVMAALGAQVSAVDIDADMVRVAEANIAQHQLSAAAKAHYVADTREMPFADNEFDFALANSVLEYVAEDHLSGVMAELARVMRPGAMMLICGTASRLAPYADHEGKWGVNYIPKWTDRFTGKQYFRGLSPRALKRALNPQFTIVRDYSWLAARAAIHGKAGRSARSLDRIARMLGQSPGLMSPTIELVLERR